MLKLPMHSDIIAISVCLTEALSRFCLIIYTISLVAILLVAYYLYSIRSITTPLYHSIVVLFFTSCLILGVLHVWVGFNTLNYPVEIDRYKFKTQLYLVVLALVHYTNRK